MIKILLTNCFETEKFSKKLVKLTNQKDVLLLQGDLGAGKSYFARAFIQEAMEKNIDVPSPTYTIVQHYETNKGLIAHYDLYRLKSSSDLLELGLEEDLANAITLIEWPERLGAFLPEEYIQIQFEEGQNTDERIVTLTLHGKDERCSIFWEQALRSLKKSI